MIASDDCCCALTWTASPPHPPPQRTSLLPLPSPRPLPLRRHRRGTGMATARLGSRVRTCMRCPTTRLHHPPLSSRRLLPPRTGHLLHPRRPPPRLPPRLPPSPLPRLFLRSGTPPPLPLLSQRWARRRRRLRRLLPRRRQSLVRSRLRKYERRSRLLLSPPPLPRPSKGPVGLPWTFARQPTWQTYALLRLCAPPPSTCTPRTGRSSPSSRTAR